MIFINKFIDKISAMESRQNKDVVIPIAEARGLRDEISKLLSDLYESAKDKKKESDTIQIDIRGKSFKE